MTTTLPLFARADEYEALARGYCDAWPAVGESILDDASYSTVGVNGLTVPAGDNFNRGVSPDVVTGRDAVVAAASRAGFTDVSCLDITTVSGDWVAVPVMATASEGSKAPGIWLLRFVDGAIHWHLWYVDADVSTDQDAEVIAAEARSFCSIIEGTGYRRSPGEFLAAMTPDPLVHNNPEGFYFTGADEVEAMVEYYPPTDEIWCGDDIVTNGPWSAEPISIDNEQYGLGQVGMMVHFHIDSRIHSQFAHFTRTRGQFWGLPLDE